MRTRGIALTLVGLVLAGVILVSSATEAMPATSGAKNVPARYRSLYQGLDRQVAGIKPGSAPKKPATVFGAWLRVANGNLGPALLKPSLQERVDEQLDVLAAMGVRGVSVEIGYPLLDPAFPQHDQYVTFYRHLADDVHGRGMTLTVEDNNVLVGTPYTSVQWSYRGLTLASYAAAKAAMANTIIKTMTPEYLSLETEADTAADATRLPLDDPANYASVVATEVGLIGPHSGTLLGAGPGTWSSPKFDDALAQISDLDYLDTHFYATAPEDLEKLATIATIAKHAHKQLVMDEAWLHKGLGPDPLHPEGDISAVDAHVLSYYQFFAPLDRAFLAKLVPLTRHDGFAFVAASQTFAFSTYLPYDASFQTAGFQQVTQQYNALVARALTNGTVNATGRAYQRLVAKS